MSVCPERLYLEPPIERPRAIRVVGIAGSGGLSYEVSAFTGTPEIDETFRYRTYEVIGVADGEPFARLLFVRWAALDWCHAQDFFHAADSLSAADCALSEVATFAAPADDPLINVGPIVEFRRLQIVDADRGLKRWRTVARHFIEKSLARHSATLFLKCFPLEYEGEIERGEPDPPSLERRIAAMRRMYARDLGVERLHGEGGEQGWMWRALRWENEVRDLIRRGSKPKRIRKRAPTARAEM